MIIKYKNYTFKHLENPDYRNEEYLGRWKLTHNGIVKYFKHLTEVRDFIDILTFNEKLEKLLEER